MKLTDERIIKFIEDKHKDEDFDLEKFLSPEEKDLRDAKLFFDIDKIIEKIKNAVSENKKILIYGDYDCDGIMSTVMLYTFLSQAGADVIYYIPERSEGYGLNADAVKKIAELRS